MNWTVIFALRFKVILALVLTALLPHLSYGAGATETEFYDAQKVLEAAYAQELSANGISIKMNFQAKSLYASYADAVISVSTDGASANPIFTSVLTRDAYLMILCHELGHGIGGLELSSSLHTSVEGQADYFAVASCLPRIFSDSIANAEFVKNNVIDEDLKTLCLRHHSDVKKQNQCLRIGTAALAVTASNVLASTIANPTPTKITTPDCSQNVLIHSFGPALKSKHPNNQCRLDTYMRGIIGERPPPCWYNVESTENRNFFETMDKIYGETNVCQKVCQGLPATASDKEREQRCLSAPCTRMLFPFLSPGKNYGVVDKDYHKNILAHAEKILAAEAQLRKDCGSKDSDLVPLEMLIDNKTSTTKLCPTNSSNQTSWKGPYLDAPLVQPIIDAGKVWCAPPKLDVDCTSTGPFERALKNCVK